MKSVVKNRHELGIKKAQTHSEFAWWLCGDQRSHLEGQYTPAQHDLIPKRINASQRSPGLMPKHRASKSGKNPPQLFFSVSDKDRFETSQARDPIRLQRPLWISSVRRKIESANERNATSDCGHAPSSPREGSDRGLTVTESLHEVHYLAQEPLAVLYATFQK